MSQQEEMAKLKAASPRRRGGRGPMGRMMPGEEAQDFKGTIGKLVRFMGQFKVAFIAAIVFAMASAAFNIVGPKVLSQATTELFDGIVAKSAARVASISTQLAPFCSPRWRCIA